MINAGWSPRILARSIPAPVATSASRSSPRTPRMTASQYRTFKCSGGSWSRSQRSRARSKVSRAASAIGLPGGDQAGTQNKLKVEFALVFQCAIRQMPRRLDPSS
jgi:hypothetical protein